MSKSKATNILFICTGNSARSVMAEVLINELSEGRFRAHSAGAKPSGTVNPLTIETLIAHGHKVDGLSSKSIGRFLDQEMDIVVTVCDNARESCPVWPKQTTIYHWGFEDPADFMGSHDEKLKFFDKIYEQIKQRIIEYIN